MDNVKSTRRKVTSELLQQTHVVEDGGEGIYIGWRWGGGVGRVDILKWWVRWNSRIKAQLSAPPQPNEKF